MSERQQPNPSGETDFAIYGGKLSVRLAWLFRLVITLLVSAITWVVFTSLQVVRELRTGIGDVQQEIAHMSSLDEEQDRRLNDHETRIRELEKQR